MKVTRREFIPAFGAMVGIPSLAFANPNKKVPQNKQGVLDKLDPTVVQTLRWIDPNLTSLLINLSYYFSEPIIFHQINYKKLKSGVGNIEEADIIHNNSDKWANAFATAISSFISYSARFPFTMRIANNSSQNSEDIKRQNKVFSDFMTINVYYGQAFADRYLTNAFQHELREAFKKILRENPQYEYQPWKIPFKKVVKTLYEIYPQVISEVTKDVKTSSKNLNQFKNKEKAEEWIKSRRNQLDLLLIFLSYVGTFVDFIPLVTGDKVPLYTANTATGRAVGNIPYNGVLCRDLLKRLKEKGDEEGYNEEKVVATAGLYNAPLYFVINSVIQSLCDSQFSFKEHSDNDVGYSNLREIIGAVNGSIIYMFFQYKLESLIRSHMKDSNKGLKERNLLTQFASWYIEPKHKL